MQMITNDKILLSLPEVESLIFHKIVILPFSRLSVLNIRDNLSVWVHLNDKKIVKKDNIIIILFSAVQLFDIPVKDFNLFKNHYRIPLGLLKTSARNVKDIEKKSLEGEVQTSFDFKEEESSDSFNLKTYNKFRNALLGAFISSVTSESKFLTFKELVTDIENVPLVYDTIAPHIQLGDFIKKEIPGNYSLGFERLIGVLTTIKDAVIKSDLAYDKASLGLWLKNMLSSKPTDSESLIASLILCDINFPEDWEGYKAFFYSLCYFAFNKEEIMNTKVGLPNVIAEKLSINVSEVQFWNTFFMGIFSERINNLYLVNSLRKLQFYLEFLSYKKVYTSLANDLEVFDQPIILEHGIEINYSEPSEDEKHLIANEYLDLLGEKGKKNTVLVSDLSQITSKKSKSKDKKINSNYPVLVAFTKDFRINGNIRQLLLNSETNSKTKTITVINEIIKTKEDIFSLEFEKLLKDFKEALSLYTTKNIEVLIIKTNSANYNDLLRNLKKIFTENKVNKIGDVFLSEPFSDENIAKTVVEAVPNTLFWDKSKKYFLVNT